MRVVMASSLVALFATVGCGGQEKPQSPAGAAASTPAAGKTVEAACGSCVYNMPGVSGCKLAVKIDGKPYLVTGTKVSAHASGLCDAAKQAVVSGQVEGDKFAATSFELKK